MNYEHLIEQMKSCLGRDKELRFKMGRLVGLALKEGKTYGQIATDLSCYAGTVSEWHRTWDFWRDDRMDDSAPWSDYYWVANIKQRDFALKARRRLLAKYSKRLMAELRTEWYTLYRPECVMRAQGHLMTAENTLNHAARALRNVLERVEEGEPLSPETVARVEKLLTDIRKITRMVSAAYRHDKGEAA